MSREVMQQALEALENIGNWLPTIGQKGLRDYEADAIIALREALAQPEPWTPEDMAYRPGGLPQPEQTHSQNPKFTMDEWVGLTDKEADSIVAYPWGETKEWVRAIEKALKEKNT